MKSRISSVDTVRVLAILAVIVIHIMPFHQFDADGYNVIEVVFNQLARFAVPFFFTIAGYFWGARIRAGTPLFDASKQTAKRILMVLGAWSVFYLLPYNLGAIFDYGLLGPLKDWYWHWLRVLKTPQLILFESTAEHLWFLVSLLWALGIATLFLRYRQVAALAALAVVLYILGTLGLAYAEPLGMDPRRFAVTTLEGPFFSTIFFVSGYLLSGMKPNPKWFWFGLAGVVIGFAIHFAEVFWLWERFDVRPIQHYVFGTYLLGVGTAVLTLSDPRFLRADWTARLGLYTLGVYAVHWMFVDWLEPLDRGWNHPVWEVAKVGVIYAASIGVVSLMARHRWLRKVVT